jgi:hypothetical protein
MRNCVRPAAVGSDNDYYAGLFVQFCGRANNTAESHAVARTNHPRRPPTIEPLCTFFPVFSSPTATIEVIGHTGNVSSEKAGVGGSTPSLATIFSISYLNVINYKFNNLGRVLGAELWANNHAALFECI